MWFDNNTVGKTAGSEEKEAENKNSNTEILLLLFDNSSVN